MSIPAIFLSFSGRIRRRTFWLSLLALSILSYLMLTAAGLALGVPRFFLEGVAGPGRGLPPIDFGHPFFKAYGAISLASIWPGMAISVKRLHDRNWSGGWLALPYAIGFGIVATVTMNPQLFTMSAGPAAGPPGMTPAIGLLMSAAVMVAGILAIWLFILMGFLRGTIGPNRFGDDPLGGTGASGSGAHPPAPGHDWAD